MPEYLAPGVYIEEVSFRSKSIEGVSTTTTGFIGPTRYGPIDLDNTLLTSLGDFKLVYGDGTQLKFRGDTLHNYMWHAIRAFFAEGGKRLYVSRVFRRLDAESSGAPPGGTVDPAPSRSGGMYPDGYARTSADGRLIDTATANRSLRVRARWPGTAGNVRVRFGLRVAKNVLGFDQRKDPVTGSPVEIAVVSALADRDVVLITRGSLSPPTADFYLATWSDADQTYTFQPGSGTALTLTTDFRRDDQIQVISGVVAVTPGNGLGLTEVWDGLALDPLHTQNGANDSLTYKFGSNVEQPSLLERAHGRELPIVVTPESGVASGLDVLDALFTAAPGRQTSPPASDVPSLRELVLSNVSDSARYMELALTGGNDGLRPTAGEYEGQAEAASSVKTGLKQFEDIEDISIVAAPGSTFGYETGQPARDDANTIVSLLLQHCQYMRYRIAVIDSGNEQSLNQVQDMRARFDSSWGAMYYPWVRVLDPVTRAPIFLPPSGFVSGIYARNDITRAVYKAPANEVVNLSIGFEVLLNKAQQDVLNPLGVNCFRFFEGRGYRLWGGRTMSSDPEWKYVSLRRYFAFLEHSIDRGTQWAVFEPNGPLLWANIRQTIEDFLYNEFVSGALLGDKPEKAYFVRCDRTTMTQNDLDNGRLVCLIGLCPVKPAEFVIFRIGQWTADRK
jgi:phage tail sheath protein FI